MKKNLPLRLIAILLFMFVSSLSFSQTIINYQTWTGASGCNIFSSSTNVPATINGTNTTIAHNTAIGQPTYNNIDKTVDIDCELINGSQNQGTEYIASVNFKLGYSYKITVNAARIKPQQTEPNALLRLDLNNGGNGGNTQCDGTGIIDPSGSGGLKQSTQIGSQTFEDYVFNYAPLSSPEPYLVIAAIPQSGISNQTILIRKITIEETPPPVSFNITPTHFPIICGSTTAIPFTINNNGGTNITNYTWNLGATPNGWKLPNGSAAPASYSTGTINTLTLTPVCGSVQKNISASITANGNNYNTNTTTLYITQPTLSINGSSSFCTGSSNYSINNLPCNASVAWSISPATGIANLSCSSCATTSLSQVGYGTVTLTAVVSNLCGGSNVTLNKSIQIGSSPLTGTYSTATNTLSLQTVNFVPAGNIYAQYQWPGVSNITATLTSGAPPGTGFYSFPGHFSFNIASGQQVSVYIAGNSACGAANVTRTFIQSSYYYLLVSPNPASNNINVGITEVADTTGKIAEEQKLVTSNTSGITKMYLYDFNTGTLVKEWNFKEMESVSYSLNIAGVKTGVYLLKMERNNKATTTKIIVK